uniref:Uncharacterized protein n=1 Tax=Malurus cyaneus samueli TaxID=2593467 RepID=A0A8C5X9P6_9PASS
QLHGPKQLCTPNSCMAPKSCTPQTAAHPKQLCTPNSCTPQTAARPQTAAHPKQLHTPNSCLPVNGGAWQGLKCLSRACSDVGATISPPGTRRTLGRWVEGALGGGTCPRGVTKQPGLPCPAQECGSSSEAVATPGVPRASAVCAGCPQCHSPARGLISERTKRGEARARAGLCFEPGAARFLGKVWRWRAGSWVPLGLEQEQWEFGTASSRPQIRRFTVSWEPGWAATATRSGHGTGERAPGCCGAVTGTEG